MENSLVKMTKISRIKFIIVLALVIGVYVLQNFSPGSLLDKTWFRYLNKPVIWAFIMLFITRQPKVKPTGKVRVRMLMKWVIAFCGVLYVIIMFLGGILGGFAKSPFDHSIMGIISNIIFIFIPIIGKEFARNYLVNGEKYKNSFVFLGLIVVLFTLIELPVSSIRNLRTNLDLITYIGEMFMPKLCNNILVTYLVYRVGVQGSLIFILIQQCFNWFFPVVPNPTWSIKILIEILYPAFTLTFLEFYYKNKIRVGRREGKKENPISWAIITIISILIIWFSAGVFPVQPFVIATGSMEPVIYPGDVVLVNKSKIDNCKVGDIIQFRHENIYIFHRIIEIVKDKEEIKYRTKGDNNSAIDKDLVKKEDIKGIVVYTVPKIGWPSLLLKSDKKIDKSEVEF